MTYNETYDYLMQIRRAEYRIASLQTRYMELRACLLPAAIRYDLDKGQTSPEDGMSRIMAEMDRIQGMIDKISDEKVGMIEEIGAAVERLKDPREQLVLTQFFIGKQTMGQISQQISYSLSRTYGFRSAGIRHLSEMMGVPSES